MVGIQMIRFFSLLGSLLFLVICYSTNAVWVCNHAQKDGSY